uniref:Transport inhibitor response 1-like protein n=1 Tax=Kalanchoe fedtschenkoi TaxID=63787 RepID=A0A7N0VBJ4_KALFE
MSVSDYDLAVLAHSLPRFKDLTLVCCEGFGTSGLAMLASNCRQLHVLDLIEDEVSDDEVDWISCFPDGETCIESLTFDFGQLYRLMLRAPQLRHLGTGAFSPSEPGLHADPDPSLISAFFACRSISCLSEFRDIAPEYLPSIYPACANLTSLNFSYANIDSTQLSAVISRWHKLQVLCVLDSISDQGLQVVAATCKDLSELRVFPVDAREDSQSPVSYVGFQAISEGCRKLRSILFFCQTMTNAAVIAMSENCPDLVFFRLCIMGRHRPDHVTGAPMDEGFGAIVKNCKKLTRLVVSRLLTDSAFGFIGKYGKLVRTLSVAFAGDSDMGFPFGDSTLRSGIHHFYNMRFLWMSSCRLTKQCCQEIAQAMPRLVVEIFSHDEEHSLTNDIDVLYMYRSLEGTRTDVPKTVTIL